MKRTAFIYLFGAAATVLYFLMEVFGDPDPVNRYFTTDVKWLNLVFFGSTLLIFFTVAFFSYKIINAEKVVRSDSFLLIAAGLAVALMYLISFNPILAPNGDNAEYIINAKSLIERGGVFRLDTPSETPNTLASIGLPLILSPIYFIWGLDFLKMKYVVMATGLLIFPALFFLLRKTTTFHVSAILVIVSFSSPYLLANSTTIMTESPYLLWSSLALLFTYRFTEERDFNWIDYLGLIFFLIAAILTRILGLSLLLAIVVYLLSKIPWTRLLKQQTPWSRHSNTISKLLWIVVPLVPAFLLWQWKQSHLGTGPVEAFMESGIGRQLVDNFTSMTNVLSQIILSADTFRWYRLSPDHTLATFNLFWIAIYFIIGIGIVADLLRSRLFACYTLAMIILLLLASATPQERVTIRYLSVLIPFLIYYFYAGVTLLARKILGKSNPLVRGKIFGLLALFFILGVNLNGNGYNVYTKSAVYNAWYDSFLKAATWCGDNLPVDAYVMSIKPRIVYLYSGLKGTSLVNERDIYSDQYEKEKLEFIKANGITHIIVDAISNATKSHFYPILEHNPDKFRALTVPNLDGKCTVIEVVDW